jgi:hypothetical protein
VPAHRVEPRSVPRSWSHVSSPFETERHDGQREPGSQRDLRGESPCVAARSATSMRDLALMLFTALRLRRALQHRADARPRRVRLRETVGVGLPGCGVLPRRPEAPTEDVG